jgi:hypothetical protein
MRIMFTFDLWAVMLMGMGAIANGHERNWGRLVHSGGLW